MFVIDKDPGILCTLLVLFEFAPDTVCSAFRFLDVAVDDIEDLREADRDNADLPSIGEAEVLIEDAKIGIESVIEALIDEE